MVRPAHNGLLCRRVSRGIAEYLFVNGSLGGAAGGGVCCHVGFSVSAKLGVSM